MFNAIEVWKFLPASAESAFASPARRPPVELLADGTLNCQPGAGHGVVCRVIMSWNQRGHAVAGNRASIVTSVCEDALKYRAVCLRFHPDRLRL